jgi:hypothetical protein
MLTEPCSSEDEIGAVEHGHACDEEVGVRIIEVDDAIGADDVERV